MSNKPKTIPGCVLGVLWIFAVMALATVARGFVLSLAWGWFVVPALHVVALGWKHAIGVTFVVGLFFPVKKEEGKTAFDRADSWGEGVAIATFETLMVPAVMLFVGWVIHQFV